MRKTSLIALPLILLGLSQANAADPSIAPASGTPLRFGVEVSLHSDRTSWPDDASHTEDEMISQTSTPGWHAFALAEYSLQSWFAVRSGLGLATRGYWYNTDAGGLFHYNNTLSLLYLSVPLQAQLRAGNWLLQAGPEVGLLLSAQYKIDQADSRIGMDQTSLTQDVKDQIAAFDLGAGFRAGYEFHPFGQALQATAGYSWGLMNIADAPGVTDELYNHTLLFNLSLFFTAP